MASRRSAEALIRRGHVRVNGKVVLTLGTKADPEKDAIEVSGKRISAGPLEYEYYLFHKPCGVVTTLSDPHAKAILSDFTRGIGVRVYPAGRLDRDSSGLLLLTNDGDLVYRLTHPSFGICKHYRVTIDRELSPRELSVIRAGMKLDGQKTLPCEIVRLKDLSAGHTEFRMVLHEGKKRQIRRMMEQFGARVLALHRDGYGPLRLGTLPVGRIRPLTKREIRELKEAVIKQS
jgi:23S rRNA pseudouridine2605 synthase